MAHMTTDATKLYGNEFYKYLDARTLSVAVVWPDGRITPQMNNLGQTSTKWEVAQCVHQALLNPTPSVQSSEIFPMCEALVRALPPLTATLKGHIKAIRGWYYIPETRGRCNSTNEAL